MMTGKTSNLVQRIELKIFYTKNINLYIASNDSLLTVHSINDRLIKFNISCRKGWWSTLIHSMYNNTLYKKTIFKLK